jgi:hypothetical protein
MTITDVHSIQVTIGVPDKGARVAPMAMMPGSP